MKKIPLLFLLSSVALFAQEKPSAFDDMLPAEGQTPPPVSGEALIEEGLSRLPLEPMTMTGRIIHRGPKGIVLKEFPFEVDVEWGAEPPIAVYKIFDTTNNLIETITAKAGFVPSLTRVLPDSDTVSYLQWNERVQGADVTWLDVTLGFLWWQNPTLVNKTEKIRGRLCDIVDIFPPTPVPNCAKIRIWLDRETKLLMQAEEHSPTGRINRRLWVRAVKKFNGRWMVRDLEVEMQGSGYRTRLHIEDVRDAE